MRINPSASNLRQWLDRSPLTVSEQNTLTPGVGLSSSVSIYTVPAGKRAVLHMLEIQAAFAAAPAAGDRSLVFFQVTRSGGSAKTVFAHHAIGSGGQNGSYSTSAPQMLLDAGDVVALSVNGAGSASAVAGSGWLSATEFDRVL